MLLRSGRRPDLAQLLAPDGLATVHLYPGGVGQRGERVALGRMQPATAEIERQARDLHGERPAAEPGQRLDEQHGPPEAGQAPGGGNAGGAGAHDGYVRQIRHRAIPSAFSTDRPRRRPARRLPIAPESIEQCVAIIEGHRAPNEEDAIHDRRDHLVQSFVHVERSLAASGGAVGDRL